MEKIDPKIYRVLRATLRWGISNFPQGELLLGLDVGKDQRYAFASIKSRINFYEIRILKSS